MRQEIDLMDMLTLMGGLEGRNYHNNGHCIDYGRSLTPNEMDRLKNGEVFTVVIAFNPVMYILMDGGGTIREKRIPLPTEGFFERMVL